MSAEQKMLFNEAEVLSAIEAAEAAHAARTTGISAHERPVCWNRARGWR